MTTDRQLSNEPKSVQDVVQGRANAHRPTLTPAENMVMTVAKAQVRDGRPVGANTTGFLLAIIDRLTKENTE